MAADDTSSAILSTSSLPSFSPTTHDLILLEHHLFSAPLSYASSFASHQLLLSRPPSQPYQTPVLAPPTDEPVQLSRRKRRKLGPGTETTPADWATFRAKEERRSTTDRRTVEHHGGIEAMLGGAVEAVREGWGGEWINGEEGVRWISKEEGETREEVDWVVLGAGRGGRELLVLEAEAAELDDLFGRIILNASSETRKLRCLSVESPGPTLVLPPSSAFHLSPFSSWSDPSSGIASLGAERGGWDVLLLDPPWPNSSATRATAYDTFDAYDLWKLDLPALLGDTTTLVAVWVTNNPKFRTLLTEKLFPAWGLSGVAEWYWIKTTSLGEPVWSLDSTHRRCYEGLLLGYRNSPSPPPALPHSKIFLSTPIGHSRKPVLLDLLRPSLSWLNGRTPNVLEMFARTTLAGPLAEGGERGVWLSVGNEAVKFNVLETGEGAKGWLEEKEE